MCPTRILTPVLVILVIPLCRLPSSISAKIYPTTVNVAEGEGFVAILEENPKRSIQSCQLTRNNKIYSFEPGCTRSVNTQTGETLSPIKMMECGVRIHNLTILSGGDWKLSSISTNGSLSSGNVLVIMKRPDTGCPTNADSTYCSVVNSDNNEQKHCSEIDSTWKNFKCEYLISGRMAINTEIKRTNLNEDGYATTELLDSGSTVLSCSFADLIFEELDDAQMAIRSCYVAHKESGLVFNIEDGLQDIRYSAYKTDFNSLVCQFEIPGAIQEHEAGGWEMHLEATNTVEFLVGHRRFIEPNTIIKKRTCAFYLNREEERAKKDFLERTQSVIVIKTMNDTTKIECAKNVSYPLSGCRRCYLLLKNNTLLFNDEKDPNCEFNVGPGNWTCGFDGPTKDDADFSQSFEVIQYHREIIDEAAKSGENGTITLECHHIYQWKLKDCLFLSPLGRMFRLPRQTFKNDRVSYYGGGLASGHCGIKLSKDVAKPGKWQCIFRTFNNEQIYSTDVFVETNLEEKNLSP